MTSTEAVRYSTETQQTQINLPLNPRKKPNHWQTIFKKYDLDGDQKISLTELRAMILSESYENDIPEHTVRMIMQKADEDQSGYIDMAEFEKMHWHSVFLKYDVDNDGRISLSELSRLLHQRRDDELPRDVVERLLQLADKNEDGFLTFDEFDKLVHTKEFRSLMGHMLNVYVKTAVVPRKSYLLDEGDGAGDYEEEYSCNPPTLCMIIVSIIEIITFVWDVASNEKYGNIGPAAYIFIYDPKRRYEAWRFLTYMFVHIGIGHISVNLLVQILLGIPLEMVHKWWRVLIIYFAGVLAGSLGTSISDPHTCLAGASGGVYALITAHVASIIMNWSEMRFAVLQLAVFFILAGSDIGTAVYNRYVYNSMEKGHNIGYVAHLAGALAGLLVGINVLRNLQVRRWEKVVWWVSLILYCGLMLAAVIWNIAYPSYFL